MTGNESSIVSAIRTGKVFMMSFIPRVFLLKEHIDDARRFHDFGLWKGGEPRRNFHKSEYDDMMRPNEELDAKTKDYIDPILMWSFALFLQRHFDHRSSVALLQTGIALERYRIRHGSPPSSCRPAGKFGE